MDLIRKAITNLRHREDGFSLMEATAAMAVAVVMFVVLAQSLSVTIRIAQENRAQQNATAAGIEALEFARSLEFEELALNQQPDGTDTNVFYDTWTDPEGNVHSNTPFIHGSVFGLDNDERVVVDDINGLMSPDYDESLDGETYTVTQYVAEVDSGLKRVVVEVTYDFNGRERLHQTSTVVTELRG